MNERLLFPTMPQCANSCRRLRQQPHRQEMSHAQKCDLLTPPLSRVRRWRAATHLFIGVAPPAGGRDVSMLAPSQHHRSVLAFSCLSSRCIEGSSLIADVFKVRESFLPVQPVIHRLRPSLSGAHACALTGVTVACFRTALRRRTCGTLPAGPSCPHTHVQASVCIFKHTCCSRVLLEHVCARSRLRNPVTTFYDATLS